jgi:hypothetical protein
MLKSNSRIEAFKLVDQAMRLQLTDDGDLVEIEECLKKALKLNPDSIEALQEAAHFYDAVVPNANRARKYAVSSLRLSPQGRREPTVYEPLRRATDRFRFQFQ